MSLLVHELTSRIYYLRHTIKWSCSTNPASKFALALRRILRHPSFFFVRRGTKTDSYNPRGFLSDGFKTSPRHVSRAELGSDARRRPRRPLSPFPQSDIPGYVYLRRRGSGKASDGGGSKVARWGIETYLLAQLAPVQQHPPLSSRRNFDPESAGQLPREIRISQICSRRCKLNSGCASAAIIARAGSYHRRAWKMFRQRASSGIFTRMDFVEILSEVNVSSMIHHRDKNWKG